MSSPRLPVETVSISIFSRLPSRIAEPLPNARSICASAASSAFCRSMLGASIPLPMIFNCAAMSPVSLINASGHSAHEAAAEPRLMRLSYRICSWRTIEEQINLCGTPQEQHVGLIGCALPRGECHAYQVQLRRFEEE